MPDLSETTPVAFNCEGGLVLNRSTFMMKPGEALELENFEPDIEGGYRRINGFSKYVSAIVPATASSSEKVLMVATFGDYVVAARGTSIYSATAGGSSWTSRDSGRTSAGKYSFERFNFDGNDKLIVADGANAPTVFNTSFTATDVSSGGGGEVSTAVTGAKYVVSFKEHMFYAGMSAAKQELVFSVPFDEDNFATGSGAGTIKVDDEITGLKVFRDDLFIFCQNRIFKLSGTSTSNFAITAVTRDIGCINGDTIQEFAGDLIFLGPDGLRTVAGTARIGDVELGTISSNVQSLFDENLASASEFDSVVIPDKTQYRIFFTKDGQGENATNGVTCVMKGQTFEFSKLRGIKPACTDSFVSAGNVIVLHGAYSGGYVYRQESGNDFDGTTILGKYRSPDMTFGDAGIRKHMQRVIVNYKPESSIDADLFLRYDYESRDSARPSAYELDSSDVAALYGTATYGASSTSFGTYGGPSQPLVRQAVEGSGFAVALRVNDGGSTAPYGAGSTSFGTYGGPSQPLVRQAVEGSGFAVALRVNDGGSTAPYSLKGFQLEYQTGARR